MARRRKKQKSIKGLVYTLALIVAVCLGYEPLTRALHVDASKGLPAVIEELKQRLPETPQEPAATLGVPLTDKALLPAPLKGTSEKILVRRGYTVSYNLKHNLPNWVAWELTPDKLIERESRSDKFLPDPDLPEDVAPIPTCPKTWPSPPMTTNARAGTADTCAPPGTIAGIGGPCRRVST